MKTKPTLLILSDNLDFIESLSLLVTRELGLSCKTIRLESEIHAENEAILVTDRILIGDHKIPIIKVILPIKINYLIDNIHNILQELNNHDIIIIPPDLQLSLQHKMISHQSENSSASLTDKETNILHILAISGEEGVSKEALLKEIWNIDAALDTHTLETHIYRLRKKIKDTFGYEIIKANDGGYRL